MKMQCYLFAAIGVWVLTIFSASCQNSILSTGNWYKIAVEQTGIHRITYDDLLIYGIDPEQVNPKNFRIYGNGNGMLPESNEAFCYDDPVENAIFVFGEEDEVFDEEDYILFYGEGPTQWTYNAASELFEHSVNLYSDYTFYFFNFDLGQGKRIPEEFSTIVPYTHTSTSFNDYYAHEPELENLIHTGKQWFGERFEETTQYNFEIIFPNLVTESQVLLEAWVAARSTIVSSLGFSINTVNIANYSIPALYFNNSNADYAKIGLDTTYFYSTSPVLNLTIAYDQPTDSSVAWLNYFSMNARRHLIFESGQLNFRDAQTFGPGTVTKFVIEHPEDNAEIWNITDPLNPSHVQHEFAGNQLSFILETDELPEFIVFDASQFYSPEYIGQVANQNLHGMEAPELIIVSPEEFLAPAQQLANFRQEHDGISVEVVSPELIYNEFSSGAQDIMAVRNFVRYLFNQTNGENPKYLLLFGDGSFDYKDRIENNTNFIPVWESTESLNPIASFCSDDYYAMLDDDYLLDIAVGRVPGRTLSEAEAMVQKLIFYSSEESNYGLWRNEMCLVADDEDSNLHLVDAEELAEIAGISGQDFNLTKLYLDAFEQVTIGDSSFYPAVNAALTATINEGVNILNYIGHGSYNALAHEKIFTAADISNWTNSFFPIFLTATCDFGRFDDPEIYSLAEQSLMVTGKGMIAVVSPSRATYAGGNAVLLQNIFEQWFENPGNRLGEILRVAKNNTSTNDNTRKHVLFGDPSMLPAIPHYQVVPEIINGQILPAVLDTLNPGEDVIVTGFISDQEGNPINNFMGNLHVIIYERADTVFTLGNDTAIYIASFLTQDSILLELDTEVLNGQFGFEFKLPNEMESAYGTIKISFYARDYPTDARGHFSELVVGGFPSGDSEKNATADDIRFYPTCFNQSIRFTTSADAGHIRIQMVDLTGTKQFENDYYHLNAGEVNEINLSELPSGFYLISAYGDGFFITRKIVKK
jgi:hypothetical protein